VVDDLYQQLSVNPPSLEEVLADAREVVEHEAARVVSNSRETRPRPSLVKVPLTRLS